VGTKGKRIGGAAGRQLGALGFSALPAPSLAERLRRFRLANRLSYCALARRINGLHLTTLRRAERGEGTSERVAARMERFLRRAERVL